MKALFLFLTFCIISSTAFAEAMFDLGVAYSVDTLKATADSGNTQTFYNFSALFNLDRQARWNVGWTFFGISQTITAATDTTTFSSLDFGPALRWNIDKAGIYSFSLAYGYLARGTYTPSGGSAESWQGTSIWGQFGFQYPVQDDKFYVGVSLNYYAGNYSKKVVDSIESEITGQKTWIFPMLSLTWRP